MKFIQKVVQSSILACLWAYVLCSTCFCQHTTPQKIWLEIMHQKNEPPLTFYWHNTFYEKPFRFTFEKTIQQTQEIDSSFPLTVLSVDESKENPWGTQIPFVVYPNDTIIIKKNQQNQTTVFHPNNLVRTHELDFFRQMNQKNSELVGFSLGHLPLSMTSQERILNEENLYKKRLKFLEEYSSKYQISTFFKDQLRSTFYYQALSTITFSYFSPYASTKKQADTLITSKFRELIKMDETFYFQPEYRSTLLNYIVFLSNEPSKINWVNLYTIALNHLKGNTKEVLLFDILRLAFQENQQLAYPIFQLYLHDTNHPVFKKYVIDNFQPQFDALQTDNSSLIKSNNKDSYPFTHILEKGNITYLDFWASWCAPCRTEMPDSKKLSEEYAKQGINFVYISIDENAVAWEKASKQIGLPDAKSYLLPNSKKSAIAKQFNISSIPRYIIIGKDGKVINADAPRPSDQKIRKLFDELLKK